MSADVSVADKADNTHLILLKVCSLLESSQASNCLMNGLLCVSCTGATLVRTSLRLN